MCHIYIDKPIGFYHLVYLYLFLLFVQIVINIYQHRFFFFTKFQKIVGLFFTTIDFFFQMYIYYTNK